MARLIHLSDLHFGAHDERLVEAVEQRVHEEQPDLVVISGDFTQRARTEQFEQACQFLERLREAGHDVLGVPGNHDVPLYDVLRRFLSPLTRYKRYIDDQLCPLHEIPGATVLGINTARSLTFKDGSISHEQMQFIRENFARTDPKAMRILVTHHPLFALPVGDGPEMGKAIGRQ
jgi:3',5'-cyclic AMP phosphodiesterase CpdA